MPNQTVYEFRSAAVREPAASAPFFAPDNVVSICDSPFFSRSTLNERPEPNPDGLGCARGLRSAFLFEAGMILLAYGIWHLCHLVR
ncbi:MAG TPA: hypothetical protein VK574_20545 [Terracidiphilus sp.]|nr:hypothetical protein [Terracidiphilus sp.]